MVDLYINGPITVIIREEADPRVLAMLEAILAGQSADVARDAADMERDLTRETELEAVLVKSNDYANRLAAAMNGVAADLQALKDEVASGTVSAAAVSNLDAAINNIGAIADAAEALDSGFPVPDPTPTPTPDEPTDVPPVDEAPGTEPVPTDGGDGSADGGAGDVTGTGDATVPAGGANT